MDLVGQKNQTDKYTVLRPMSKPTKLQYCIWRYGLNEPNDISACVKCN